MKRGWEGGVGGWPYAEEIEMLRLPHGHLSDMQPTVSILRISPEADSEQYT